MEEKKKAYLVCNKTLRELEKLAQKDSSYNATPVYECNIDRSDLSEEQKKIQAQNTWLREENMSINFGEYKINEMIEKFAYEELLGGRKEKLEETIHKRIMDTETKIFIRLDLNNAGEYSVSTEFIIGNCDEELEKMKLEEVDDIEELEEKLKSCTRHSSFSRDYREKIYLERVTVRLYSYRFNNLSTMTSKLIAKFFRENLTYCIKSGVVIVPEEYLEKGKEGINEWREMKKNKNKNNSMEKRILRQALNDKKIFAVKALDLVMHEMCNFPTRRWDIPGMEIEGRFNQQKVNKLMVHITEATKQQQFMDMSKEEIVKKTKDYWKNILMEAYKRIDNIKVGEENAG